MIAYAFRNPPDTLCSLELTVGSPPSRPRWLAWTSASRLRTPVAALGFEAFSPSWGPLAAWR